MFARSWIITCTFFLAFTSTAWSASLTDQNLSVPMMAAQADGVFIGNVLATQCVRSSARGAIQTLVTLEVQSEIKGRADNDGTVRILVPGGRLGNKIEIVRGTPHFTPSEQVLIFLTSYPDGYYGVLGMAHGKFTLEQDSYRGTLHALQDPRGLQLLEPDPTGHGYRPRPMPQQRYRLSDLIEEIEQSRNPAIVMR